MHEQTGLRIRQLYPLMKDVVVKRYFVKDLKADTENFFVMLRNGLFVYSRLFPSKHLTSARRNRHLLTLQWFCQELYSVTAELKSPSPDDLTSFCSEKLALSLRGDAVDPDTYVPARSVPK